MTIFVCNEVLKQNVVNFCYTLQQWSWMLLDLSVTMHFMSKIN